MTLESVGACPAGQHERGQHGQSCENPLHLSLPSRVLRLFIGRLGRRLKGLPRSDTPQRREELSVILAKIHFQGATRISQASPRGLES